MSRSGSLVLRVHVHVPGAEPYEIGEEIWQQSLAEAIASEAQTIAEDAGADLLEDNSEASRNQLRDQVIADMTRALVRAGDTYSAPDGVRYSLTRSARRLTPPTDRRILMTSHTDRRILVAEPDDPTRLFLTAIWGGAKRVRDVICVGCSA